MTTSLIPAPSTSSTKPPRQIVPVLELPLTDALYRRLALLARESDMHLDEVASRALERLRVVRPRDTEFQEAPEIPVGGTAELPPGVQDRPGTRLQVLVSRRVSRQMSKLARKCKLEPGEVAALLLLEATAASVASAEHAARQLHQQRVEDLKTPPHAHAGFPETRAPEATPCA